jgi:hypothetical protein
LCSVWFEYGLLTFIDSFDFDCDFGSEADSASRQAMPRRHASSSRFDRAFESPGHAVGSMSRFVNSTTDLGIRIDYHGRAFPRLNPEIQPVVMYFPDFSPR